MRPRHYLAPLFSLISLSLAAQVPLAFDEPSTTSSTLVDVLSADEDYTTLLQLLQRAKLIPTLNRLNGSTLFAPTNDAIKHRASEDSFWAATLSADESYFALDNVKEQLRQELFYHLLNYTIADFGDRKSGDELHEHKTLHFPRLPLEPPSREPPPGPPWMPVPGGTLGGEPQRLRTVLRDKKIRVGVDAFGDGGVRVVKDRVDAANGAVVGIGRILKVPLDLGNSLVFFRTLRSLKLCLASVIKQHSELSYFHRIMDKQLKKVLNETEAMTLFLPVDSAWDTLHPLERVYLESEFASDDLQKILSFHAVVEDGVHWSDSFQSSSKRAWVIYAMCTLLLTYTIQ
jgi:solute carrier family 25 (mitochondrial carnitine/acylcarnitine transporter), member 20/29